MFEMTLQFQTGLTQTKPILYTIKVTLNKKFSYRSTRDVCLLSGHVDILSWVVCTAAPSFVTLSPKRHDFRKKKN
jgi:hypothetical protein